MDKPGNIALEITEEIGILKIDNPPGNFILSPEFISLPILKNWIEENGIKGLLITGTGRHFSGGASLETLFDSASLRDEMESDLNKGMALLQFIQTLNIPVVAAIQGTCFGGGVEIALSCHIRIAATNALFAFPEVNHSLIPGLGGTFEIMQRTSMMKTISLILGGDMISAEEALTMKVIDQIVPKEKLFDHTFQLLKKITAGRNIKVIHSVMQAVHNARRLTREKALKEETRMFCELAFEEVKRRRMENRK
ncbi:MAG: enoyl-CoA hydratase/isomerase family protein [Bacteroidota bacterium]